MKHGLVIGKFMPVHAGHIALIRFAAQQCDVLTVSMSYKLDDPISGDIRYSWLNDIFSDDEKIKIAKIVDDFDNETLPWSERTKGWANFILKQYGPIQVVVSSEGYGPYLAHHLGAEHVAYDPDRKKYPISASAIRQHPFRYWESIPAIVRPHFVKKICFYGPESTGKSVMAKKLAEHYNTEYVPEVARKIVNSNTFTVEDILKVGSAQTERVLEKIKSANKILICDTDLITTQIYCRHYLGVVPPVLNELERQITYDQYFLFDIDVPWVADNLRDLGQRRQEMYEVFRKELELRNIPFIKVQGSFNDREVFLKRYLDQLLND